ncbi:MAG: phage tail protein [Rhodospirillales bacterium]
MARTTNRVAVSVAASAAVLVAMAGTPKPAAAGPEPFIGELMLVPYTFCPRGFAEAQGQLLAISQFSALFSLVGTTYGGDGRTTFALPDLRGRVPVGFGQGPGLANVQLGERAGADQVTLTANQMPAHTHGAATTVDVTATMRAASAAADRVAPAGNVLADGGRTNLYHAGPAAADMNASAIAATATAVTTVANAGGNQAFDNRQPFLGLRWCIALEGIFPSRS